MGLRLVRCRQSRPVRDARRERRGLPDVHEMRLLRPHRASLRQARPSDADPASEDPARGLPVLSVIVVLCAPGNGAEEKSRATSREAMNDQFAEWLKCARVTDDPEGDFIADMRRDPDRPQTFTSMRSVRNYV